MKKFAVDCNSDLLENLIILETTELNICFEMFGNPEVDCLFIVDSTRRLVGSLTEGDIRRFVIKNKQLPSNAKEAMNRTPLFLSEKSDDKLDKEVKIKSIKGRIPVVDESQRIIGLYKPSLNEIVEFKKYYTDLVSVAPTRVSFSGGGSDLESWFEYNDGLVINLALKKYARVHIRTSPDENFNITSINTNETLSLSYQNIMSYNQKKLRLVVETIRKFDLTNPLDIKIFCDFEPGSGLGGSSSLVVALVAGLCEANSIKLSKRQIAEISYEIERKAAMISGGWQDQIAASYGGLLAIDFYSKGFKVSKFQLSKNEIIFLENSLFILPIGSSRESSKIHDSISKISDTEVYKERMNKIVDISRQCKNLVIEGQFEKLGDILHRNWIEKREISSVISTEEVDEAYSKFLKFGATGGKLLGAGGAGYLLMFVKTHDQARFLNECNKRQIKPERINLDIDGVQVFRGI